MDELYCPCPAAGCENKRVNYWYHHNCGGKTMIRYDDIHIICKTCWRSGLMFDWLFSCSEHTFRATSKQGCLYALAILGQQRGNVAQIMKATKKLVEMYPE
jgi:hypothetical protein